MEELLQLSDIEELMSSESETIDNNQPIQPMESLARQPFSSPHPPSRPHFHIPTFRPPFPARHNMPKRPFIPMQHSFTKKYSEPDLTNLCEKIVKTFIANEVAPPILMPMEANVDFEENN